MTSHKESGLLQVIGELEVINEKLKKRKIVLFQKHEKNSKFDKYLQFELTNDNCDLIDNLKVFDEIEVTFNIEGRKVEKDNMERYYLSLRAYKIKKT